MSILHTTTPSLPAPHTFWLALSGHRDLALGQGWQLQRTLVRLWRNLRQQHGQVGLISQLADGSDRVVARAALAAQVPFHALLPMPLAAYQRTFVRPQKQAFDTLYQAADQRTELHSHTDPFRAANAYMLQQAHGVLALWDERSPIKAGGTSEVVSMPQMSRFWQRRRFLQPLDCATKDKPLFHVSVKRRRNPQPHAQHPSPLR